MSAPHPIYDDTNAFVGATLPQDSDTHKTLSALPLGLTDSGEVAAKVMVVQDNGGGGGGGGGPVTPVNSQVPVTDSVTNISPAAAHSKVEIYNNGNTSIWITTDGSDPGADSGTETAPDGDAYGFRVYPGGYYTTNWPITTAINGISAAGQTNLVTVSIA